MGLDTNKGKRAGIDLDNVNQELLDEDLVTTFSTSDIEKVVKHRNTMPKSKLIVTAFIAFITIGFSVFQIYTAGFGTLPSWQHRAVHVTLALLIVYCLYPSNKEKGFRAIEVIPVLIMIGLLAYVIFSYPGPELRQGAPNNMDMFIATVLIVFLLVGTNRTTGKAMPIIALLFLIYIFVGRYFPGILSHQGFRYTKMVDQMFNGTVGIFGTPAYVSSTVLTLYVIWGIFLIRGGAGKFFTDLAIALTGRMTGGPAMSAVVSSAMVGSITGNGAANVAITGSFTIPLMKKIGYRPEFAGAVEAVASQGGNIMPPIMGAAAFIMAEYLGIPYIRVAAGAAIPAIFYFLIAGILIYLQARKRNLKGLSKEEVPKVSKVLKEGFYNFIPIVFIVWVLVLGYSPMKAGFWAIFITIGLSYIKKETRLSFLDILECLEKGAKTSVPVVMACATAGIVVGSISLTGLGIRFSRFAIELAAGRQIILLIMIMISSIILGMGMPVSSAYIILAILGVPPLVGMGVEPLAAHMFVFYFGVISGLTPPVAITAYTAAGIAGSDPMKTGILSVLIGAGGFLLPYMFVYNPELLLISDSVINIILVCTQTIIACGAFAVFAQGYLCTKLNYIERGGFLLSSLMLVDGNLYTSSAALFVLTIVILVNYKRFRKDGQVFVDVKL
jgi:TRAP transporter 4TM/12TM fusion protein